MTSNSELRVAFVIPSWERGWRSQPILREFVELFPHTVVFTGYWPGFTRGYEGSFEVRQLHGVSRSRAAGAAPSFRWVSPRNLWALWRYRPDVIFTNGFHLCAFYGLLLRALLGTRVVLLWQGVSAETGGGPGSLRLWVRKRMARFFDLAISNTHDGVEYLRTAVGFPAGNLWHEIGEVGDRDSLGLPEILTRGGERPVFLFVGRTIREKGLQLFLEAGSLLLNRGLKHFSLLIVGDGQDRQELQRLAQTLGLENHVRWEGFIPYDHLGAFYQACDVFVLPSLEDTWGVTVAEAMLFGKAILCSKYAGARELVQQGVNGFVFDSRDPRQLADYMSRFIQQPELLPRLGAASTEIISHYTPQRTAEVFANAVSTAMNGNPASFPEPAQKTCSTLPSR